MHVWSQASTLGCSMVLHALLVAVLLPLPQLALSQARVTDPEDAHIHRVEAGLLPIAATRDKLGSHETIGERLRALLADRFQLVVHKEIKEQPIYALVPAKNGSKLQEAQETGTQQNMMTNRGRSQGHAIPMEMVAQMLSGITGRPVVDRTGLTAKYDFVLEWTPDMGSDARAQGFGDGITSPAPAPGGPTIFTALQEQLGLRLDSQKGPVENIVIDRVEKPSEN